MEERVVKRRNWDRKVTAKADYPWGVSGTPNVFHLPVVDTHYYVYRTTLTRTREGHTTTTHSWWCEVDTSFGAVTSAHCSWQAAMDYACRQAKQAA